ncbi:helix-turn-helix domain-containing protein [Propionimicrobium sp. PCR01-08-3]|uniref:helix-turn-helix transcriptional regulator n=1 Tax=Propionimicrobium sp. PCR01-08-3 TaxID=3052086 RepID=UPI00255C8660|nr:helix-turn-helix domain-containing protein [Propionimicrobium sp. PCR01-08-3]WIY81613.1 helix-turn-helix domain-containing protein [Propionimicrobium sp. PCR01-08-3]
MEIENRAEMTSSAGDQAAATDASTRQRVLDLLLERGTMTAAELADALELTPAGVRRHLIGLVDGGQITTIEQTGPRGRGRPASVYQLTATGRKGFGQAYDDLALSALAELVAIAGPDAIDRFAERRLTDLEDDYRRRRTTDPEKDPMEVLAEALSAAGYFAETEGSAELCQHHCPVVDVATEYPQLCDAETSVFARLLGTDVSRSATIAHGALACRLHVGGPTPLPNPVSASADRKVIA